MEAKKRHMRTNSEQTEFIAHPFPATIVAENGEHKNTQNHPHSEFLFVQHSDSSAHEFSKCVHKIRHVVIYRVVQKSDTPVLILL